MILDVLFHQRFWAKVNKTNDCWLWTSATWGSGYGQFWLNGRSQSAHRVAWVITNGKIPQGLDVLHTCDTPLCVNPFHLFLGTALDNNRDRAKKGRNRNQNGEKHNMSKLAKTQIDEIRALKEFKSQREIAQMYGVSQGHVSDIQTGKRW